MSKKKARKPGKQATAPPPQTAEDEPVALVPENPNVESDAPAAPRRSIEGDEGSADGGVERADQ